MSPLIQFNRIVKRYGQGASEFTALNDVSFDINEGEFVAIMGPSGSGKSTVMNLLGCLDSASAGEYLFDGVHVEQLTRDQLALLRRHYLGFVFQGFNLLARTTALENVELPLLYRGMARAQRHAAARKALALVGLDGWENHRSSELSGGQQQRVAIARALVTNPRVLLADEPTGNLDTARSKEIMQLLSQLNSELGITILMVTHESEMAQFAQRLIHFVDGQVEHDSATNKSRSPE
ncbi:ABC transporter ATP-binding protein [Thiomicrorhabdus aquaedulcis]|uniref:ABC transporter ATP-binding protein n=1 Tax=Thiomicrorhabdus aquaedulcis TaxID=2211106 RepID=UPI000FD7625E|nr:ABC transporter ATP-binding protein [Thiomicrorhabdus aquaedulcis]